MIHILPKRLEKREQSAQHKHHHTIHYILTKKLQLHTILFFCYLPIPASLSAIRVVSTGIFLAWACIVHLSCAPFLNRISTFLHIGMRKKERQKVVTWWFVSSFFSKKNISAVFFLRESVSMTRKVRELYDNSTFTLFWTRFDFLTIHYLFFKNNTKKIFTEIFVI